MAAMSAVPIASKPCSPRSKKPFTAWMCCSTIRLVTTLPAIPTEELAFQDWNAAVAINLTGAFLCCNRRFG